MPEFFVQSGVVSTYKNWKKHKEKLLGIIWKKYQTDYRERTIHEKHRKTLNTHSSNPYLWQTLYTLRFLPMMLTVRSASKTLC
jgi:hypothetical protein